ncbi:M23 family metallopeptidase (plasmid) [Paenibacillus cellulosilyticus]|nr:M23 family metallopeptidase [Paenibacillus cellulosilyticus]
MKNEQSALHDVNTTIRTIKRISTLIGLLTSPYVLIAIVIAAIGGLLLIVSFLPFLIFADPDNLRTEYSSGVGYYATQLDSDGTLYQWPVPSIATISSYFGERDIGEGTESHGGIDIADGAANTENQPIYAMAAGTVIVAGAASGFGQAIYIDHGEGLITKYGHLSTVMDVSVGDQVLKGQRIGFIGAGKVGRSTGPHLHFQVELDGRKVNPLIYVSPPVMGNVPIAFTYHPLNLDAMITFLKARNSALANEQILSMIDRAGRSQNIDPHLLLAITGQEQSFVPANHPHASEIIRNPWNVFGCWCSGKGATLQTEEAAAIAAKTIVKLSQGLPAGRDPVQWLVARDNPSGYYASDTGWWIGVSKFFKALLEAEE